MSISKRQKSRLRWACRRGMLELDLFLIKFFNECYDALSSSQQNTFVQLLEQNDQDLYEWFTGRHSPEDQHLSAMVQLIRQHARS